MSLELHIDPEVTRRLPDSTYGIITCRVANSATNEMLWEEILELTDAVRANYTLETVKEQPVIAATREAYKALGGDPNRYRPSADALLRRVVKGNDLYRISTLVDLINYISLKTGYSIGGFDMDQLRGAVRVGIGRKDEPYEGVGRGTLNIEGLQVLRDEAGAFGTPTSDHVRTSVQMQTRRFYMHIYGYSGLESLKNTIELSVYLLQKYGNAEDLQAWTVPSSVA